MAYTVLQGNNIDVLKTYPDNHFDSIVTDPPYGIDFLGKDWDANTGALETYQECLRVLKPGGHILAFSAARTYHHLAVTIERAGFEIRDQIMWIYSSGFPKSQDIGKSIQRSIGVKEKKIIKGGARPSDKMVTPYAKENEYSEPVLTDSQAQAWAGWGTQLKPAHEPICMARKPIKQSIAKNCQEWGTGALNIDATRIPTDDVIISTAGNDNTFNKFNAENNVDGPGTGTKIKANVPKWTQAEGGRFPSNVLGEIPEYQKYFYCPKVSRRERHIGFDKTETLKESLTSIGGYWCDEQGNKIESESEDGKLAYVPGAGVILDHGVKHEIEKYRKANNIIGSAIGNNHPTVKPVALMEYLIKLVTPPGGLVLDPFNGSGSTGMAAVGLGYDYVGIDLDPKYVAISLKRIEAWTKDDQIFNELFEANE